ncbi:hypothetical protein BDA96_04G323000 [Sorghum bicolor]|uniref:Uncharacterized protein n=1 Tax=Sorghum bicolor TaxID=4558 RepID=A0A921UKY3_SORBI|nr:hypothetical protein BDA96_04G323000 [Sorghum bicolor]
MTRRCSCNNSRSASLILINSRYTRPISLSLPHPYPRRSTLPHTPTRLAMRFHPWHDALPHPWRSARRPLHPRCSALPHTRTR